MTENIPLNKLRAWEGNVRQTELTEWQNKDPDVIYDLLTEDEVIARDRRMKFIGLETYVQAGGRLRRDLFRGAKKASSSRTRRC